MFSEFILVGIFFGWQRPNYKMLLGKIILAIPMFSYFLFWIHWILYEPERNMFFIL